MTAIFPPPLNTNTLPTYAMLAKRKKTKPLRPKPQLQVVSLSCLDPRLIKTKRDKIEKKAILFQLMFSFFPNLFERRRRHTQTITKRKTLKFHGAGMKSQVKEIPCWKSQSEKTFETCNNQIAHFTRFSICILSS